MKTRVRVEPENLMGLWACEVGSASADFTHQKQLPPNACRNRSCRSRLTGTSVEVGTETADFNTSLLLRPKLHDDVLDSPSFAGCCWNCDGGPRVSVARPSAATPVCGGGRSTMPSGGASTAGASSFRGSPNSQNSQNSASQHSPSLNYR